MKKNSDLAASNIALFYAYADLARWRSPTGVYLLFFPCCWGIIVADPTLSSLTLYIKFFIGSILMRGAGCTLNDILDKDYDALVARTQSRPLASGQLSVKYAWMFCLLQVGLSFLLILTFRWQTVATAAFSLILVAAYPLAKRVTYLPQVFLGVVFNWGVLLGFIEVTGFLSFDVICVYVFGIIWTTFYDTVYAFQDIEDDLMVGVKSLTILIRPYAKIALLSLLSLCFAVLGIFGLFRAADKLYYGILFLGAVWITREFLAISLTQPAECLKFFKKCALFNLFFYILFYWS